MENSIRIHVPVSVSYTALEGVLKSQLIGKYIPKPEKEVDSSPYAQILDVGIGGSSSGPNRIVLRLKIKILRTVMKRDQVDLYVLATLKYDNSSQLLYVQQFQLTSRTSSGLYNTALEVLVNNVAYNQILSKARVPVKDIINQELIKVNAMLEQGLDLKGIKLMGAVDEVTILDIAPRPDKVTFSVELKGNAEANILDLSKLLGSR
ncbi:DUF4403 domain-containing protein [Pontibacter korlensis]|uniref:DUF4403 family protein n=1 Tax=Pontibacter korlensis TaxID=400092 RepID=A0A0E3ZG14_9BACT|nr:DUF4403 family protein [Pontibacter korlensis]AKD03753.1 hypothetical protein PKOR_12235 [Pontibacter korlensis]